MQQNCSIDNHPQCKHTQYKHYTAKQPIAQPPSLCPAVQLTGQGQRCLGGSVSAVWRGTDTMISSAAMSFLAARPRTPSKAAGCSLANSTPGGGGVVDGQRQ